MTNEAEYLDSIREELVSDKSSTQLVVVYNFLLQQKRERQKQVDQNPKVQEQKEVKKKDSEPHEPPPKHNTPNLSVSVGNSPATKRQKGKKPIIISAKGEATPEKPNKKKSPPSIPKKSPQSPMEKVAAVATRQRSSSLTNKNGKTPQYEVNEEDEYSDSEEEIEDGNEKDKTTKDEVKEKEKITKEKEIKEIKEKEIKEKEKQEKREKEKKDKIMKENGSEYSDEDDSSDEETEGVGHLDDGENSSVAVNPIINNVSNLSSRQRSASVSPHVARPVLDFDDVISGKINPPPTKSASQKKKITNTTKNKTPHCSQ